MLIGIILLESLTTSSKEGFKMEQVYAREEKYRLALYCILEIALNANTDKELRENLHNVRLIAKKTLEETKRG